jgi:threonine dehydratase
MRPNRTFAEGLSTGQAAQMTLDILLRDLDDFQLVEEDDIRRGMLWWLERCHTLAESAAGAVLAAAYNLRHSLHGRRIGLILSGGNTSLTHLKDALTGA